MANNVVLELEVLCLSCISLYSKINNFFFWSSYEVTNVTQFLGKSVRCSLCWNDEVTLIPSLMYTELCSQMQWDKNRNAVC